MKMELVESFTEETKKVNYFGIEVFVPVSYPYIATAEDGEVMCFTHRPKVVDEIGSGYGFWNGNFGNIQYIARVNLNDVDWKETLQEIPYDA